MHIFCCRYSYSCIPTIKHPRFQHAALAKNQLSVHDCLPGFGFSSPDRDDYQTRRREANGRYALRRNKPHLVSIFLALLGEPTQLLICRARFLGYAGVSWLLCVPSFFITSFAAWRLFQTPRLFLSSAHNSDQSSTFPNITFRSNPGTEAEIVLDPRKSFDLKSPGIVTTPNTAHSLLYKGRMSSSTTQEESRYHIPFNLTPNASDRGCSPSIPEFAPISNSRSVPNPGGSSTFLTPGPLDDTDPYHSRYVPQKRRDGSQTDVEYETAGSLGWIAAADYSPRLSMDSVLSKLDDLDPDYVEQVDKKVPPQCAKPVRMESYGAKHTSQPLSQGSLHIRGAKIFANRGQ